MDHQVLSLAARIGQWNTRMAEFLLVQHIMPCTITDHSTTELLMGQKLTVLLDRLNPNRELYKQLSASMRATCEGSSSETLSTQRTTGQAHSGFWQESSEQPGPTHTRYRWRMVSFGAGM